MRKKINCIIVVLLLCMIIASACDDGKTNGSSENSSDWLDDDDEDFETVEACFQNDENIVAFAYHYDFTNLRYNRISVVEGNASDWQLTTSYMAINQNTKIHSNISCATNNINNWKFTGGVIPCGDEGFCYIVCGNENEDNKNDDLKCTDMRKISMTTEQVYMLNYSTSKYAFVVYNNNFNDYLDVPYRDLWHGNNEQATHVGTYYGYNFYMKKSGDTCVLAQTESALENICFDDGVDKTTIVDGENNFMVSRAKEVRSLEDDEELLVISAMYTDDKYALIGYFNGESKTIEIDEKNQFVEDAFLREENRVVLCTLSLDGAMEIIIADFDMKTTEVIESRKILKNDHKNIHLQNSLLRVEDNYNVHGFVKISDEGYSYTYLVSYGEEDKEVEIKMFD